MLPVSTIMFVICNVRLTTVSILQILNYKIDSWIQLSAVMILLINHANNPVIYGLTNRNFREAISKAFSRNKARNILRTTRRNEKT